MTNNLFKKAAVFTDLHIGGKNNSIVHNDDCFNFVKWFCEEAKKEGCETAIMMGDWHNNRASVNVHSLNYSMRCLELLNSTFKRTLIIAGNHDIHYRENRDVHSLAWARYLPNVEVVDSIHTEGDVTLCPWLVGDEYKEIKKIKSRYVFGHFELPHFFMNSRIQMPDHGTISADHFAGIEYVFSGHFHKRQAQKNIWYIGNAFPHNYADVNDDARGMMMLEWGSDPEFRSWPGQPIFRAYKLSEILEAPEKLLLPNSHVKVSLDVSLTYEEANTLRETLIPAYNLREMSLIASKDDQPIEDSGELEFQSVDQIMLESINMIESNQYDKNLLTTIYTTL